MRELQFQVAVRDLLDEGC